MIIAVGLHAVAAPDAAWSRLGRCRRTAPVTDLRDESDWSDGEYSVFSPFSAVMVVLLEISSKKEAAADISNQFPPELVWHGSHFTACIILS